jgi:hypothetical protein
MTPFEVWYGKKSTVQHLRTFWCVVHVKDTTPNLKKLDEHNRRMIFIGYEPGSKAFRAYGPLTRKIHVTRDVIFDEQAQWDWAQGGERGEDASTDTFSIEMEYTTTVLGESAVVLPGGSPGLASPTSSPSPPPQSPPPSPVVVAGEEVQHGEHDPPLIMCEEDLDIDHDEDAPLCLRQTVDILGPTLPQ